MFKRIKHFLSQIWLKRFNQNSNVMFYLDAPKYVKETVDSDLLIKKLLLTSSKEDIDKLDENLKEIFLKNNCSQLEYEEIKKFSSSLQLKYLAELKEDVRAELVADLILSKSENVIINSWNHVTINDKEFYRKIDIEEVFKKAGL